MTEIVHNATGAFLLFLMAAGVILILVAVMHIIRDTYDD